MSGSATDAAAHAAGAPGGADPAAADQSAGEQAAAVKAVAALYAVDANAHSLGIELVSAGPGTACVRATVRETMTNAHGLCHGGVIFSIADTAFGYACNSRGGTNLAAHAAIDFLAPGRVGDVLVATAREKWRAGRTGLYEIEVATAAGARIALFHGRSQRLKDRGHAG